MKYKVIFTADLHGNKEQYSRLLEYVQKNGAKAVIIGGDLSSGDTLEKEIETQRNFFKNKFRLFMQDLSKESKIFLIMGNDDWACNSDVLYQQEQEGLFKMIHKKREKLNSDFDIMGYSLVPITPFGIKDWEKYDLSNVSRKFSKDYEKRKKDYKLEGFVSAGRKISYYKIEPEDEKINSIQRDLNNKDFIKNPKKTVYVIHTPPHDTNLDKKLSKESIKLLDYLYYSEINKKHEEKTKIDSRKLEKGFFGSFAVREFIEKNQPYLTLHGHIHETVFYSGKYIDKIGKTLCASAGNDNRMKTLVVLIFDLYNPEKVRRKII